MGLILHCGGEPATIDQLAAIPVPHATDTYHPVAHVALIDTVKERMQSILGMTPTEEAYGTNQEGAQLFGTMRLPHGGQERTLSIGLRNSYNQTLSVGFAAGAWTLVCDNLCFSGSDVTVVRKHTKNVWRDILSRVDEALYAAPLAFDRMEWDMEAMKEVPVKHDRGFELLGLAYGHSIITPQQMSVAVKDWKTPRHEEFSERNGYSLYNCVTEGLKKGNAGGAIKRHTKAHAFLSDALSIPPMPITVAASYEGGE